MERLHSPSSSTLDIDPVVSRWLILLMAFAAMPAMAQSVVTSAAPDGLSVTVYRDPARDQGAIDPHFPTGFALVTETRRIRLPAGDATIRFEGVADGMIAVSAVVSGLPGGVIQKNRDAQLLSPTMLILGALGKPVHLRRTDPATGKVVEQDAVVRSTPDNGLLVESAQGVEALRCSGLPETIVHDDVPAGLSAKPTLSVTTRSDRAAEVSVTLTYLATGFDWSANYVARIAADGGTFDLFAWMTVANGNDVSFPDAKLLAVAGRLNHSRPDAEDAPARPLMLECWPSPTYEGEDRSFDRALPPPPAFAPAPMAAQEIMLTARRVAQREDLGDLKLYRVPMPVTINASGQKQVVLLHQKAIPFTTHYRVRLSATGMQSDGLLTRTIRFDNKHDTGAGIPLPSGGVTLFDANALLVAQTQMRDHAAGERVDMDIGQSPQHHLSQTGTDDQRRITITNANATPVIADIELVEDAQASVTAASHRLNRRDGALLWRVTVPANGLAHLDYRLRRR